MKRLLLSIFTCVVFACTVVGLPFAGMASAQPSGLSWLPSFNLADASVVDKGLMTQLETEILPQLEEILSPQQREQFKAAIGDGVSFRKAFKSLTLSPDQKAQLKTLLKSIAKKDAFASLTPEQKQQLFLKKKEMMMPTTDEIIDKINTSMKGKGTTLPEGVKEKIDAGLKKKDTFMPTSESISEKIKAGVEALKEKIQD